MQGDPVAGKKPAPIATLKGWIPATKSGVIVGGDGAQIKFDVGDDAHPEIANLIQKGLNRELLIVIFEADPDGAGK